MGVLPDSAGLITRADLTPTGATSLITVAAPSNFRWRLYSISFTLTTAATVANRRVYVKMPQTGTDTIFAVSSQDQPASTTYEYSFVFQAQVSTNVIQVGSEDANLLEILPGPLELNGSALGAFLQVDIFNFQVGDQFSDAYAYVEQWESL